MGRGFKSLRRYQINQIGLIICNGLLKEAVLRIWSGVAKVSIENNYE